MNVAESACEEQIHVQGLTPANVSTLQRKGNAPNQAPEGVREGKASDSDQVQHHLHGTKAEKKGGGEESDLLFGISH